MKLLFAIAVDLMIFATILVGIKTGNESLLNISHFFGWFCGGFLLLSLLIPDSRASMEKTYKHQTRAFRMYDVLTDLLFVVFFAYQGWMVLAGVYATASVLKADYKKKQEKKYETENA